MAFSFRASQRTGQHRHSFARRGPVAGALAAGVLLAGCSSASSGGGGSQASAPGISSTSVTVGLITSITGPVASLFTTVAPGFEARIDLQNAEGGIDGRKIRVVVADDGGSATQALAAAQELIDQDNAFAVGSLSAFLPGAEPLFISNDVPVVGMNFGGSPNWSPPHMNFFPVAETEGSNYPAPVSEGAFFKQLGVTNVAIIGNQTESSVKYALNVKASAQYADLQSTYSNTTIPATQTNNFGAVVQAMQQHGVDAVAAGMSFAQDAGLLQSVKQSGMKLKAFVFSAPPTSTTFDNASVRSESQGAWAQSRVVPPNVSNSATSAFNAAIVKYTHSTATPDMNEELGWITASAIIKGLEAAGKNPTRASFTSKLRAVRNFTGDGLEINPVNFTTSYGKGADATGPGPQDCIWMEQYKGTRFAPMSKPLCGGLVPNSNAG